MMIIDIVPISTRTVFWTVLLGLGLPMAITSIAMLMARADGAAVVRHTLLVGALAAPVAVGLLWALARNEIRVTETSVDIKAGLYTLSVPRAELDLGRLQVVARNAAGEFSPAWRSNGIALPGYQAGWFRLRSGERAFHLVTGPEVLAVPTTRGIWLVLSPSDPGTFREAVATPAG